jgi:glycosyltransferase involved in cell wall biosynthesis
LRASRRCTIRLVVLDDADAHALSSVVRAEVATLPNWIDVPAQPIPLPPQPPLRVVYVGGLISRKGLPQILDSMRAMPDAPIALRIVGGPGDEGEGAADEYRRSVGSDLTATVAFAGELSPEGVRHEIQAAHVFLLPSAAEGMPRSLLEAMAEGRAAIVTDAGTMAAVVRDADCGVVLQSADPDVISTALLALAADPEHLAELGRRAHLAARDRYSSDRAKARIDGMLTAVVPPVQSR